MPNFWEDDDCDGVPNIVDGSTAAGGCYLLGAACLAIDPPTGRPRYELACSTCYRRPAVDLRIDSNNDGVIDCEDDEVEDGAPGRIVLINDDDDDGDGTADREQGPGPDEDDELVELSVRVPTGEGTWWLTFPEWDGDVAAAGPRVRAYRNRDRSGQISSGVASALPAPETLWVEGCVRSAAAGDMFITLSATWDPDGDGPIPMCSAGDTIRATILLLSVKGPGDISLDEETAYAAAVFSLFDEADIDGVAEIVDGMDLELQYYKAYDLVDQHTDEVTRGSIAHGFSIGTTNGGNRHIVAEFMESTRRSSPFSTQPGATAKFELLDLLGPTAYDGESTSVLTLQAFDQFDNPVRSGTTVSWSLEGASAYLTETTLYETLFPGLAVAGIGPSSISSSNPLIIRAQSGSAEFETNLTFSRSTGILSASPTTLNIDESEWANVVLQCQNVADGAEVSWIVSNGQISGGDQITQRVTTTQVVGGTTAIQVVAAEGALSRSGPCEIVANVGDRNIRTTIQFVEESDFDINSVAVRVTNPVIAGDLTQDTDVLVSPDTYVTLPGDPASAEPSPSPVTVTCPASSEIQITGLPLTSYEVKFVNAADGNYLTLQVEGEPPNDQQVTVHTNWLGKATVRLTSRGTFISDGVEGPAARQIGIYVGRQGAPLGERQVVQISLTTSVFYSEVVSSLTSFLGLTDPETGPEIAANVAGGIFIIGDIGAIAKNLARFAGVVDGEPNWFEVILSGAGLLTELAVGGGEIL